MWGIATTVASLLLVANGALAAEESTADIRPKAPLVERSVYGDSLNFDILVTNPTDQPLFLGGVEIAYLDAGNVVLYERALDHLGRGIDTIPERTIAPKSERLVYNPFPLLPPDVKPKRVQVRVFLHKPADAGKELESAVLVQEGRATISERTSPAMTFPMKGRIFVWDGHDLTSHHRRWDYATPVMRRYGIEANAGRYSYDFVIVDEQNRMTTAGDERNESYLSFGAPVYAPRDGVVVEAEGGKGDDKSFSAEEAKANPNTNFGNYVVIDHGDGLFSLLGHLKQGTLNVKVGDQVTAGQQLGGAGASGSSLFAHLHYQLMDAQSIGKAEGVPSYFEGLVRLRGKSRVPVDRTSIDSGDIVETQ
jgi:murein DD-endopeptidase MepM/ murein hydrolase activator NlpD